MPCSWSTLINGTAKVSPQWLGCWTYDDNHPTAIRQNVALALYLVTGLLVGAESSAC